MPYETIIMILAGTAFAVHIATCITFGACWKMLMVIVNKAVEKHQETDIEKIVKVRTK